MRKFNLFYGSPICIPRLSILAFIYLVTFVTRGSSTFARLDVGSVSTDFCAIKLDYLRRELRVSTRMIDHEAIIMIFIVHELAMLDRAINPDVSEFRFYSRFFYGYTCLYNNVNRLNISGLLASDITYTYRPSYRLKRSTDLAFHLRSHFDV